VHLNNWIDDGSNEGQTTGGRKAEGRTIMIFAVMIKENPDQNDPVPH
jgi:hypothetical protein